MVDDLRYLRDPQSDGANIFGPVRRDLGDTWISPSFGKGGLRINRVSQLHDTEVEHLYHTLEIFSLCALKPPTISQTVSRCIWQVPCLSPGLIFVRQGAAVIYVSL